jgi:two-component system, NarL family, nitrate/nitrite response regulator NarL
MAIRCLIVDDSAGYLEAARTLLEREGLMIVGAVATYEEALRTAEKLQPDLVLIDIGLGEESGLDLARRLAAADSRGPAVILISTRAEEDFADEIAESPAVGFLAKTALSTRAIHSLLDAS